MNLYADENDEPTEEKGFLDKGYKLLKSGKPVACAMIPTKNPTGVYVLLRREKRFKALKSLAKKAIKQLKADKQVEGKIGKTVFGYLQKNKDTNVLEFRISDGKAANIKQPKKTLLALAKTQKVLLFKKVVFFDPGQETAAVTKDEGLSKEEQAEIDEEVEFEVPSDEEVEQILNELKALDKKEDEDMLAMLLEHPLRNRVDENSLGSRLERLNTTVPGFDTAVNTLTESLGGALEQLSDLGLKCLSEGRERADDQLVQIGTTHLPKLATELDAQFEIVANRISSVEAEIASSGDVQKSLQTLLTALEHVEELVTKDKRIYSTDGNPFAVKVFVGKDVGTAVKGMETTIKAAMA